MVRQSEKGGSLEAALATAGLAGLAAYAQDAVRHGRPSRARSSSPRRSVRRASPFGRRGPFRGGMDMATLEGFAAEAAKAKADDVPVDDGQDGGRRRRKPSARKKHGGMDFAMLEGFQAAAAEEAKKAPASPTADQDGGRRRRKPSARKKHGGMDFAMLEGFAAAAAEEAKKAPASPTDQVGGRRRGRGKKHGGMDFAMLEGFEAEAAKAKTDDLPVDDGVDSLQDGGRRRRKPKARKHGGMDFAMLEGFEAAAAEEAKKAPVVGGRRKGARKGGYTSLEQLFATFGGFNDAELAGGKKKGRKGARRGGGPDEDARVARAQAELNAAMDAQAAANTNQPVAGSETVTAEEETATPGAAAAAVQGDSSGGRRKRVVRRRGGELVSLDGGKKRPQKKKSR